MMTKICTDVEQSNKLIELGIDVNTADMCYHFIEINKTPICIRWEKVHDDEKDNSIPAWSLAALLSVLPYPHLEQNYKGKWYCRTEHVDTTYLWEADNPIDACVEMVLKLHEQKLL